MSPDRSIPLKVHVITGKTPLEGHNSGNYGILPEESFTDSIEDAV